MNFRDYLVPILIALGVTLFVQYYIGSRVDSPASGDDVRSGQMVVVPRQKEHNEPIRLDVDFLEQIPVQEPVTTKVETDLAVFELSSEGAAISKIFYKQPHSNGASTLQAFAATGKQDRCLLLAFEEKTPLFYELVAHTTSGDLIKLTYRHALGKNGAVEKEFTFDKTSARVDLKVSVHGVDAAHPLRARVIYPSPLLQAVTDNTVRIIANDDIAVKVHTEVQKIAESRAWTIPTLFGADDRYFVHAMVHDAERVLNRSYLRYDAANAVTMYLETKPLLQDRSWTLSFYFGPKSVKPMAAVDSRLEVLLNFGWLTPISRFTLLALNKLNDYIHSYGLSIILLTLILRLLLLPLTIRNRPDPKKQAEFEKQMAYINQKYKHDPEMLNKEREELMRTQMPGMLGGCLPMLIYLPLIIALNRVLSGSFELYQASFLWLPNLSASDPYYILAIVTALFQGMFAAPQMKKSGLPLGTWTMALLFGGLVASVPAGLALSIVTTACLSPLEAKLAELFGRKS